MASAGQNLWYTCGAQGPQRGFSLVDPCMVGLVGLVGLVALVPAP